MKKIFAIIISVLLAFSFLVSCGNDTAIDSGDGENTQKEKSASDGRNEVVYSDDFFINNGHTDYIIISPDDPTSTESFAVGELNNFISLSTGCRMEITEDGNEEYSAAKKFISVGKTSRLKKAGISVTEAELKTSGFIVKTIGDAIYIVGAGDMGTLCGVYEFLEKLFDYRFYASDEIYYKKVSSIKLPVFDSQYVPNIDIRVIPDMVANDLTYAYRNRMSLWQAQFVRVNGNNADTALWLVPKADYLEGHRLSDYPNNYYMDDLGTDICFSNEEAWDIMVDTLKTVFSTNPNFYQVMIGQQDNKWWCECDRCKKIISQYGGVNVSTAILCANYVEEKINEWGRAIGDERVFRVGVFAYQYTMDAPTTYDAQKDEYKPLLRTNPNVFVMFAPIHMNYAVTVYDDLNANYEEAFRRWSVCTDHLYVWTYGTNFSEYLIDFANWSGGLHNFEFYEDVGVEFLMEQGRGFHPDGTDFLHLRIYLTSQLSYDNTQDFNELIDDWFKHYFKEASDIMYQYFDELLDLGQYNIEVNGMNIWGGGLRNKTFWPRATLLRWRGYIEQAREAVSPLADKDAETYEKLCNRIDKESLMIRYLLITLYPEFYTSTELYNEKVEFKTLINKFGIRYYKESNLTVDALFKEWGV